MESAPDANLTDRLIRQLFTGDLKRFDIPVGAGIARLRQGQFPNTATAIAYQSTRAGSLVIAVRAECLIWLKE